MLDYILIGLVLDKKQTGYDIKKEVENSIGNFYKISYGRMYPTLKALADKGLLTMTEQMEGKRLKRYYMATEKGREVFINWLSAPIDLKASGEAQLAQIFFYGELPKEVRDIRLQEFEIYIQQALMQFEGIAKALAAEEMDEKSYYGISTLYYGLQNAHNILRWIRFIKEQKPLSEGFIRPYNED
ncbi:MAG: PadR family transcriptional regulator [Defluviitaleaceae bacterium]|nr:PadR family transcriptional regulator [Defluviitaleaceae bacterium]